MYQYAEYDVSVGFQTSRYCIWKYLTKVPNSKEYHQHTGRDRLVPGLWDQIFSIYLFFKLKVLLVQYILRIFFHSPNSSQNLPLTPTHSPPFLFLYLKNSKQKLK